MLINLNFFIVSRGKKEKEENPFREIKTGAPAEHAKGVYKQAALQYTAG